MAIDAQPVAWLLMAAGDDRQYGGNTGYDDEPDVYYSWDSTVNNHARVRAGDVVAVWDKQRLLGVSVIETITAAQGDKLRFRCANPACGRANIKERQTKRPRFRCQSCRSEFDTPLSEVISVTRYQSRHDAAWSPLESLLDGAQLRDLCESPGSQLSMRQLNWGSFRTRLASLGASRAVTRLMQRAPGMSSPSLDPQLRPAAGHRVATVRVRRGQQAFRSHLLSSFGEQCAVTGSAPTRVLEAGHLYSYAELGEHHEHGGLLLRRDIHRLFDDGGIAVNPATLRLDIAPSLAPFAQYRQLEGAALQVKVNDGHLSWLEKHWEQHRS